MIRTELCDKIAPVLHDALIRAEPDILARCGPLQAAAVRMGYHLVVNHATDLLVRLAVEVVLELTAVKVMPMLAEANELWGAQPLHPAVKAALQAHAGPAPF